MAVADADYQIMYADIGAPGASHDSGIFSKTSFKKALDAGLLKLPMHSGNPNVPYHFLADDAFPLSETILKPYPGQSFDEKKRVFNYRFSRARRCVENSFGIMASRFRILRVPILQDYEHAVSTVKAVIVLHNILLQQQPPTQHQMKEAREQELPISTSKPTESGTSIGQINRDILAEYFFSDGQIDFQWEQTFRTS